MSVLPNEHKRYIYDALYGPIDLDYDPILWDVISSPELQRLREVRLCNINSLCLTGGANINRFEHAIGTCYLAQECLKSWPLFNTFSKKEARLFLLAALLHDAANAAFGHSLEYIESAKGFNPEQDFKYALLGKRSDKYKYTEATYETIFFNMGRELVSKISARDFDEIGKMVRGAGRFGPLISGLIDLDNIDNVLRMAYHIGIVKSGDLAIELAKSMWVNENGLVVTRKSEPLIKEWQLIRYKLYKLLLLNPEEFSGKAMLSDAICCAKEKDDVKLNWYDVDSELLKKVYSTKWVRIKVKEELFKIESQLALRLNDNQICNEMITIFREHKAELSQRAQIIKQPRGWVVIGKQNEYQIEAEQNEIYTVYKLKTRDYDVADIVMRLMKGNLYGCLAIFSTDSTDRYPQFASFEKRLEIENQINNSLKDFKDQDCRLKGIMVSVHPILDINKTERQLNISFDDGVTEVIGEQSKQLLLGIFLRNADLNMYSLNKIRPNLLDAVREEIAHCLTEKFNILNLTRVDLYAELSALK